MRWAMIDIETLSVEVNAVILQIAAVTSDGDTLSYNLSTESQRARGMDADTFHWWMQRVAADPELAEGLAQEPRIPLRQGLLNLSTWWERHRVQCLWAHAQFDPRILDHAYRSYGFRPPWGARGVLDLRTLLRLSPETEDLDATRSGHHHALQDALHQADQVHRHLGALKAAGVAVR